MMEEFVLVDDNYCANCACMLNNTSTNANVNVSPKSNAEKIYNLDIVGAHVLITNSRNKPSVTCEKISVFTALQDLFSFNFQLNQNDTKNGLFDDSDDDKDPLADSNKSIDVPVSVPLCLPCSLLLQDLYRSFKLFKSISDDTSYISRIHDKIQQTFLIDDHDNEGDDQCQYEGQGHNKEGNLQVDPFGEVDLDVDVGVKSSSTQSQFPLPTLRPSTSTCNTSNNILFPEHSPAPISASLPIIPIISMGVDNTMILNDQPSSISRQRSLEMEIKTESETETNNDLITEAMNYDYDHEANHEEEYMMPTDILDVDIASEFIDPPSNQNLPNLISMSSSNNYPHLITTTSTSTTRTTYPNFSNMFLCDSNMDFNPHQNQIQPRPKPSASINTRIIQNYTQNQNQTSANNNGQAEVTKLYKCRFCTFMSLNPKLVKLHEQKFHMSMAVKSKVSFPQSQSSGSNKNPTSNTIANSNPDTNNIVFKKRKSIRVVSFKCKYCNFRSTKNNVITHERIHTGEKPFACTWPGCTFRARHSTNVTKHLRTHSDEKLFTCKYCPFKAKYASSVKKHIIKHH